MVEHLFDVKKVSGSSPATPTMTNEKLHIIYEDDNLLVIDKPAGLIVFPEKPTTEITLIDLILKERPELKNTNEPPRYGIAHRLDKDTSGILLVAKDKNTLDFLQKQFKSRQVSKKYTALVVGQIKTDEGIIDSLIGRSPKNRLKQKAYPIFESESKGKRKAITKYRVLQRFKDYTMIEAEPLTGRKHQIRVHLEHINHPITGDKLYGFKNQPTPKGLTRQFLHASYIKIIMQDGRIKEFNSTLPEDLTIASEKI